MPAPSVGTDRRCQRSGVDVPRPDTGKTRVTLYAGGDATKVEAIASLGELDRASCVHLEVRHQCSPDGRLLTAKRASAHGAPGAVRTDQRPRLEIPALAGHPHQAALLLD